MMMSDSTFFPLLAERSNIISSVDHHHPNFDEQYQSNHSTFLGFDQFFDGYGFGFDDDHDRNNYNYPPQNNIIIGSTDIHKAEYSISSFPASPPLMLDQTPLTTTHHRHHMDSRSSGSNYSASASSVECMSMNKYHDMKMKCKEEVIKKTKREEGINVFVFRTKTQLETLADGYKWRKYGKKMVKSNPNPRNYYKCSSVGCKVKKKVERDAEDSRYLRTTYEGIHNHQSPCDINYLP